MEIHIKIPMEDIVKHIGGGGGGTAVPVAAATSVPFLSIGKKGYVERFFHIIGQIAPTYGWSVGQCTVLATALFEGLQTKGNFQGDHTTLSLSPKLDMCWHALLLETELYASFCREMCKKFVHHTTATANDADNVKRERVLNLKKETLMTTGSINIWAWEYDDADGVNILENRKRKPIASVEQQAPPKKQSVDDTITIFIKTLTGSTANLHVKQSNTILQVKKMFQEIDGTNVDEQKLIYAGRHLEDGHTLAHYNIYNESTLHCVRRLRGC